MNQKFLIGEWVERRTDDAIGIVIGVEPYDGEYLFRVRLQRSGDPSLNEVLGSTDAWRHHHRVHAHVEFESSDCDGRYSGGRIDRMISTERCDQLGDLRFKERVTGDVISFHSEGTLRVTPEGMEWSETTEEGYRHATVTWCEYEGCTDEWRRRDHSAEKAGY